MLINKINYNIESVIEIEDDVSTISFVFILVYAYYLLWHSKIEIWIILKVRFEVISNNYLLLTFIWNSSIW